MKSVAIYVAIQTKLSSLFYPYKLIYYHAKVVKMSGYEGNEEQISFKQKRFISTYICLDYHSLLLL